MVWRELSVGLWGLASISQPRKGAQLEPGCTRTHSGLTEGCYGWKMRNVPGRIALATRTPGREDEQVRHRLRRLLAGLAPHMSRKRLVVGSAGALAAVGIALGAYFVQQKTLSPYDEAISYTRTHPSFTPKRTVEVATATQ